MFEPENDEDGENFIADHIYNGYRYNHERSRNNAISLFVNDNQKLVIK